MDTKSILPPVKIAILVDGGFFIKRFNSIYNRNRNMSGSEVANYLYTFAHKHVGYGNVLYRIFYYDCIPFGKKMQNPISKKTIDYSKTDEFRFRSDLLEALKCKRKVALRLGELKDNKNWIIHPQKVKELFAGKISLKDLQPEDVSLELRQKGLARREGVDFILDPMKANIEQSLFEHIDGLENKQIFIKEKLNIDI